MDVLWIVFVGCCWLVGIHPASGKLYCHQCLLENGTICQNQHSQCRRCPDDMQMPFYCYERRYNVSSTKMVGEKDCIRKDFWDAGWPCFPSLKNCWKRKCSTHMCNDAVTSHIRNEWTLAFSIFLVFLLKWLML